MSRKLKLVWTTQNINWVVCWATQDFLLAAALSKLSDPPINEIWLFENLILKIQLQGHG